MALMDNMISTSNERNLRQVSLFECWRPLRSPMFGRISTRTLPFRTRPGHIYWKSCSAWQGWKQFSSKFDISYTPRAASRMVRDFNHISLSWADCWHPLRVYYVSCKMKLIFTPRKLKDVCTGSLWLLYWLVAKSWIQSRRYLTLLLTPTELLLYQIGWLTEHSITDGLPGTLSRLQYLCTLLIIGHGQG